MSAAWRRVHCRLIVLSRYLLEKVLKTRDAYRVQLADDVWSTEASSTPFATDFADVVYSDANTAESFCSLKRLQSFSTDISSLCTVMRYAAASRRESVPGMPIPGVARPLALWKYPPERIQAISFAHHTRQAYSDRRLGRERSHNKRNARKRRKVAYRDTPTCIPTRIRDRRESIVMDPRMTV